MATVYRHRLLRLVSPGWYPSVLGRTQWNALVDPDSTTAVQRSDDTTVSFLQWYGFGQAEEVFVDMGPLPSCRGMTELRLETTPATVTPISLSLPAGSTLSVSPMFGGGTLDLDFALYDADFDALPGFGVRRPFGFGVPEGMSTITEGTYYLAVSQGALVNHLAASPIDYHDDDDVLDHRGAVLSARATFGASFVLAFGPSGQVAGTFTAPWEVLWYRIDVDVTQNTSSFCPGDGSAGQCPCGTSVPGQGVGCLNSTGHGARLFAMGGLGTYSVDYVVEDVPPHTAIMVFASLSSAPGTAAWGGNLCLGPGAIRFPIRNADATGRARIGSQTTLFDAGIHLPGTTVYAQAAYRDAVSPVPCHVNLTNGESLTLR
jgi:hypothetical protein